MKCLSNLFGNASALGRVFFVFPCGFSIFWKCCWINNPVAVHLSREQVLPGPWPGFGLTSQSRPPWEDAGVHFGVCSPHHHPVEVQEVLLCWKLGQFYVAHCGPFEIQPSTNPSHGSEADLWGCSLGGLCGICCAKGTLWLVILERNQLLLSQPLFLPAPLSALLLLGPM